MIIAWWHSDSAQWISQLWAPLAQRMCNTLAPHALSVVFRYRDYTARHAPRFGGDMAATWQVTSTWRSGPLDYTFLIESLLSQPADTSMNMATAPFNVAWGKQEGFKAHRVWIAVPTSSGGRAVTARTRGQVRRKLAAWAAARVNPAYGIAASGGDANAIIDALHTAGVPPYLNVHSRATEWAFDDWKTLYFGEYLLGEAMFLAMAEEWRA